MAWKRHLVFAHTNEPEKEPDPQDILEGELAVNNAADNEFLSIVNTAGEIARFSSDSKLISQTTGSTTGVTISQKVITDELEDLQTQIDIYAKGVKLSMSVSPSIFYTGENTYSTINMVMSGGLLASVMKLYVGSISEANLLDTAYNTANLTKNRYFITGTTRFVGVATYKGTNFTASTTSGSYYPVYSGFCEDVQTIVNNIKVLTKLSVRSSAVGRYTDTAPSGGGFFFLLVPEGVTVPSSFSMGGAPYVIEKETQVINGIRFTVCKSGAHYDAGAPLDVTAAS